MTANILKIALTIQVLAGALLASSPSDDLRIISNDWFAIAQPAHIGAYHGLNDCESRPTSGEAVRERLPRCEPLTRPEGVAATPGIERSGLRFVYRLKVRNTGDREIRAVHWEYDFLDRGSGDLLYRHTFQSELRIGPGEIAMLIKRSLLPPTPVIHANAIDIDDHDLYAEHVRITQVDYADEQGGKFTK